jgi:hypothetical protein
MLLFSCLHLPVVSNPAGAALITPEHRQESLARAYVQAIAGHAGLSWSVSGFDYGTDLSLREVAARRDTGTGKRRYYDSGAVLDIQLKSTANAVVEGSEVRYDLRVNAYDDLRNENRATPYILVLHVQPKVEEDRLVQTKDALVLAGCCYWTSLRGSPEVSSTTNVRIRIPGANVFSVDALRRIMKCIVAKEPL